MNSSNNNKFLALLLPVFLVACTDSSQQQSSAAPAAKAPVEKVASTAATTAKPTDTASTTSNEFPSHDAQTTPVAETGVASALTPPTGRLTGVVEEGGVKRAIVDADGKAIHLFEGREWDGWQVASINSTSVVLTQNGQEARLELQTAAAPVAVNAPAKLEALSATHLPAPAGQADKPRLVLNEEQKSVLRANLLASH